MHVCVRVHVHVSNASPSVPQLKAYQEDFEAERRDRERISDEKQSAALKYEAEITSLRLQLDRCRDRKSVV